MSWKVGLLIVSLGKFFLTVVITSMKTSRGAKNAWMKWQKWCVLVLELTPTDAFEEKSSRVLQGAAG